MTRLAQILAMPVLVIGTMAGTPSASAGDTGAFLGGLAAGAIVGGAIAGSARPPVYVAPGPVYAAPPVYYRQPRCWYEQQPLFNQFGQPVASQTVRVCR